MDRRAATWIPPLLLAGILLLLSVPVLPCPACRGAPLEGPRRDDDHSHSSFVVLSVCPRCYDGFYAAVLDAVTRSRWSRGRVSAWERLTWRTRETDWYDADGAETAQHPRRLPPVRLHKHRGDGRTP